MGRRTIDDKDLDSLRYAMSEIERLKKEEALAASERAKIEKWVVMTLKAQARGKTTFVGPDGKEVVSVTKSVIYKVDGDKLDQIAKEQGLEAQLPVLFRFKAELNADNWNAAEDKTRIAFAEAVTASNGKPSVSSDAMTAELKDYKKTLKEE